MHALVSTVLLRVAGFDAFDRSPEPEPPDRESGQVEESIGAREGDAIVGADSVWQTEGEDFGTITYAISNGY